MRQRDAIPHLETNLLDGDRHCSAREPATGSGQSYLQPYLPEKHAQGIINQIREAFSDRHSLPRNSR